MTDHALLDGPTVSSEAQPAAGWAELTEYALLRLAVRDYPADGPAAARYRAVQAELTALRGWLAEVAEELSDRLYASATGHDEVFHRASVLPLRRDVHNARSPRPALRRTLDPLAERLPLLRRWLDAHERIAALLAELAAATPAALEEERVAIAELCGAAELGKAVTLTSPNLWHAVSRYAAGNGAGSANRKSEPNVLRYVLRGVAKTSPLSWFTPVAWATWDDEDGPWPADFTGRTEPSRVLVDAVSQALLSRPDVRRRAAHRLAPALRESGDTITFRRDVPVAGSDRVVGHREQEVSLPATAALLAVVAVVRASGRAGITPAGLAAALSAEGSPAITGYVGKLLDAGLLVPVQVVDVHDAQVLDRLAGWIAGLGAVDGLPRLAEVPAMLAGIAVETAGFAEVPAAGRGAGLTGLRAGWERVGAAVGLELVADQVVTEDVTAGSVARLDRRRYAPALDDLGRFTALVDLFDTHHVVRRLLRDRFVDRYGVGGRCARPEEFAHVLPDVLREMVAVDAAGTVSGGVRIGPEVTALAALRAQTTAAVLAADTGAGPVRIPSELVDGLAAALPSWLRSRPGSVSYFVQGVPDGTFVLNHVYGGWSRFLSRFLPGLPADATEAVRAQLARYLPAGGRPTQFRPVNGFNANLHPMLVADELAEDPSRAGVDAGALELVHDADADQLRLVLPATGELVDVLYLGFLIPYLLPDRMAFLHTDLASGQTTFDHLVRGTPRTLPAGPVTHTRRLTYGDLIVQRASWQLHPQLAAAWTADLGIDPAAASRWRAELGLPEQVFVRAGSGDDVRTVDDFQSYLTAAKPQFVDLGSALHLHCLPRWARRYPAGLRVEEALPSPAAGRRVTELVVEAYRGTRPAGGSR